jgi:glycosyltransferase involved in cell wall biosynthesis
VISFCIPAHDEERLLPATIAAIKDAARTLSVDFEIVVADDGSTDGTAHAAVVAGARVIRIERRLISAARNAAARAARGDVIMFVDADTRVHARAVSQAIRLLQAGCIGGGALVRFDGRVPVWATLIFECMSLTYRLVSLSTGSFMFCTRDAFRQSGGFDEKLFAKEEVHFAIALKRVGRFRLIRDRVLTSGRKLRAYSLAEWFGIFGRLALKGSRAMSSREGLDPWYGPRRPDSEHPDPSRRNHGQLRRRGRSTA